MDTETQVCSLTLPRDLIVLGVPMPVLSLLNGLGGDTILPLLATARQDHAYSLKLSLPGGPGLQAGLLTLTGCSGCSPKIHADLERPGRPEKEIFGPLIQRTVIVVPRHHSSFFPM